MLIPCIDLQGGQAVQLVQGRRRELAVADVFGLLESFRTYTWIHLIDLDAALGKRANGRLIRQLCLQARDKYGMKVRVGGGIRSVARASKVAAWGVDQIIVGSAAFQQHEINAHFLESLCRTLGPSKIVIALDTAEGQVVTHGWRQSLPLSAERVMPKLEAYCGSFLCTDVDREGTMSGANLRWFRQLRAATAYPIIAAGGIKTRREVAALERIGMDAAVGMAVYKNRLR